MALTTPYKIKERGSLTNMRPVGSKTDVSLSCRDVRFTPKSGRCRTTVECPLSAKNRLLAC